MHEFICCENIENCFTLSSDEIRVQPQALYFHPLYLLFHRDHLQYMTSNGEKVLSPCDINAKDNYSLFDLFHPITSMMLSQNLQTTQQKLQTTNKKSNKKSGKNSSDHWSQLCWKMFLPVLTMDSCLIR